MSLFQICPVCDMQQDLEPYDVCQVCGHEWTSQEIRSSTPVPVERNLTQDAPDLAVRTETQHNPLDALCTCRECWSKLAKRVI